MFPLAKLKSEPAQGSAKSEPGGNMEYLNDAQRKWLNAQSRDVVGEYEEAAAILEYDQNNVREVAEKLAFNQVYRQYGRKDQRA